MKRGRQLIARFEVVVENLLLLSGSEVGNIHDNCLLTQKRERVFLQVRSRTPVYVVATRQNHFGAVGDRRHHLIHSTRPFVGESFVVADRAKRVVYPEELVGLLRVPARKKLGGRVHPSHSGAPLVQRGHRECGGNR